MRNNWQQKGVEVLSISGASDAVTFQTTLDKILKDKPVQGVYWLPALDNEGLLSGMDIEQWHESLRVRVKSLYLTMRKLYDQVAAPGTFLVAATRLGGQHGYDAAGAIAPMGGAVVGFTKAYKRERPDALVKAVDFAADRSASEIADALIEETLWDPGAVEIGYKNDLRWTVGLQEQPASDGRPGLTLNDSSVFLITGAAGSIVSAITADLAAASGGTFYLLDLVPEPDAGNPDLARFVSDKDGLKRDLFARIQARGERATPALVEKELAGLERAQAALSAIQAVQAAGGTAHYFSVNLADAEGIARVIEQVRQRSGRIDVLLHAAGLERSHFLPDKDATRVRPRLRREGRWMVQPAALDRRHATGGDGRVQFRCRTDSATADRRITAPPTTCCANTPPASGPRVLRRAASSSIGRRGAASAWQPAAPFPR